LFGAASGGRCRAADEPKPAAAKADKVPSYKTDVAPLLSAACANCHSGKKKKAGLDVESFDSVSKFVKAGEPDKSKLHNSLLGKGAKLMPPKNPLEEREIATIRAWIAAGAKKD
ncbi:MAG: c-type cytochrome domain-containing protein, partial [Gemmata sp.]